MLQYVNSFNCLHSSDEGSVVIRFLQSEPHLNEDGSTSVEQHDVTSVVLTEAGTRALINSLEEILSSK